MKFRFFSAAAFTLLAAMFAFGQTGSKDDVALKSLVKKMTDAQIAYDSGTLDKIYTSDYIEISPLGEFDPREKVLGFYKPEERADAGKMSVSLEATDFSIRSYGGFAIVIVHFSYAMVMDGKSMPPRKLRAMIVCRKEKGDWKIASAQYTGIRPPQPPKT
jgi:ketosteroid isomerase-like protein